MDEIYIKKVLTELKDRNFAGKVLDLVEKDGFRANGWSKLSKSPIGLLAGQLNVNEKARISLFEHTCEVYFGKSSIDDYKKIVEKPIEDFSLRGGYLAAYALRNEEDSDDAQNLLIEEPVEGKFFVDELPNNIINENILKSQSDLTEKTNRGKNAMKLLGYIRRISSNSDRDYFNFYPLMELDDSGKWEFINDVLYSFPNRGNIFLYCRYSDDILYDNFLEQNHYIIEISDDDLEENYKRNGERNETNYKLNAENLINHRKSWAIDEENIYYVVEPKNLYEIIDFSGKIFVNDENYYIGDKVLLKINDELFGPFKLTDDENSHALIIEPEKYDYIFNSFKCINGDINVHIKTLKSGYIENKGEITKNVVIIDGSFIKEVRDFIPTSVLFDKLTDYLINSKTFNDKTLGKINSIKEEIIKPKSSFAVRGSEELTAKRFERVFEILNFDNILESNTDALIKIIKAILLRDNGEEQNLNLIFDKIIEDKDLLCEIVPKYKGVQDEFERLRKEIDELKAKEAQLRQESIDKAYQEHQQLKQELLELENNKVIAKNEIENLQRKLSSLIDIDHLTWEVDKLRREKIKLEGDIQTTVKNMFNGEDMANTIAKSIGTDYISQAIIDASANLALDKDKEDAAKQLEYIQSLEFNKLQGTDLINDLCDKVSQYRSYSRNTIKNILICYSQGFLTVFSGEPGTGKTSICNILGHVLGLDNIYNNRDNYNRYIPVSVERGWTSKRDFIGYYNPLTKTFESNNSRVYAALKILNKEVQTGNSKYPMVILLDEANLSPMEYYWADFMNLCDDWSENNSISLGNNESLSLPQTLRFLATINNDHTTEILSPRLIDRAWVITLPSNADEDTDDLVFTDTNAIVPWINFVGALTPKGEMSARIKNILTNKIYKKFKEKNIPISTRINKAIKNYCIVAQEIFDDDELSKDIYAVDFAISQKLLPKLSGDGENYRKFLEELYDTCKMEKLNHSANILAKIIQRGDSMMGYYKFF